MNDLISVLTAAAHATVGAAIWRHRRIHRSPGLGYLAAASFLLAALMVTGVFLGPSEETVTGARLLVVKAVILGLLCYPLLQYLFLASLKERVPRRDQLVAGSVAVVSVFTLALPRLPGESSPRPIWLLLYVLGFSAVWLSVSLMTAFHLWSSGRGLPVVTRRRMQLLAVGSLVLGLAVIPSAISPRFARPSAAGLAFALLPLIAAASLYLAVTPPLVLRAIWRRKEDLQMTDVQTRLASAVDEGSVAAAMLASAASWVGAEGSALVTGGGTILGHHEFDPPLVMAAARSLPLSVERGSTIRLPDEVIALSLASSWLLIRRPPYAPLFGAEEMNRLRTVGVFVDLALDRASLFQREKRARQAMEDASAELEALVLGLSHDLRNPAAAVIGFLSLLERDAGISDESQSYIGRIRANTEFMQELVDDLLELSRVGRVQTEEQDVDLAQLVREVSTASSWSPEVELRSGPLPVVRMNPVRARQLFANVLGNAVHHAGRPDVKLSVSAESSPTGGVRVVIQDNGIGVPSEQRERAFAVFERLRGSAGPSGTGIGLAMCRRIMDGVAGDIAFVDSAVGARLAIDFPRAAIREERRDQDRSLASQR